MGWSNGATLATLTLKHPDMFKVAAPGAGDVNLTS
jgi:dipeptidyl aminopeptidase/acylaminoacyl peptidase